MSRDEKQFVALLQTVADGLDHAVWTGTKKSVSATTMRPCRSCNCTSSERRVVYDFLDANCPRLVTTTTSHLRDMALVAKNSKYSKFLGVSAGRTAFAGIVPGMPFQFVEHAVSDYACHNTLEGITKHEVQLSHAHLFKDVRHALTYEIWSDLVSKLPLVEEDRRARPQVTPKESFHPDRSLLWSAAHTKVYALNSVALLEPYIDASDVIWQSWVAHCDMLYRMFATGFTCHSILALHKSILEHYTLFTKAYPTGELPKNMWNLHMAMDIVRNGTPAHNSCIRMESGHRYFKQLNNSGSINKKSQIETMARRYCRHKAYNQYVLQTGERATKSELVQGMGIRSQIEHNLLEDSGLQQLLLQCDSVLAFLASGETTLLVTTWPRVKYFNHEVVPGRAMSIVNRDGELVVGHVVTVIELTQLGPFFVVYHRYTSGVVNADYVVTSSLTTEELIVEFNTQDLTFLTNMFPRTDTDRSRIVWH